MVAGRTTAASFIDILIAGISIQESERARVKTDIRLKVGLSVPLEILVASTGEFERWQSPLKSFKKADKPGIIRLFESSEYVRPDPCKVTRK